MPSCNSKDGFRHTFRRLMLQKACLISDTKWTFYVAFQSIGIRFCVLTTACWSTSFLFSKQIILKSINALFKVDMWIVLTICSSKIQLFCPIKVISLFINKHFLNIAISCTSILPYCKSRSDGRVCHQDYVITLMYSTVLKPFIILKVGTNIRLFTAYRRMVETKLRLVMVTCD